MIRINLNTSVLAGSILLALGHGAAHADTRVLEEIVVTAQKRTQSAIDVPIAISMVSAKELQKSNITSSRDLGMVVSGLSFTEQGGFVQPKIRGVGTSIVGAGADSNIGIYVDGVYLPSQSAALFELNDIESVQVLKGPQGSLYGRNATGGAIVITTAAPSFETKGSVGISYARYNEIRSTAYITGGLSERVAGSLSVVNSENSGYTDNVALGTDTSERDVLSVRGKLLFQATEDLSFLLTGHYVDQEDNAAMAVSPLNNVSAAGPNTNGAIFGRSDHSKVSMDHAFYSDVEGGGVNLNINYDMGWANLTSVSSYSNLNQPFASDVDGTEIPIFDADSTFDQETVIQEIYITRDTNEKLSWIAGATYYSDESETLGSLFLGGAPYRQLTGLVETTAYAFYAEFDYKLTDRLSLTMGGRFSKENKDAVGTVIGLPFNIVDSDEDWEAFTPRLSLHYTLNENSTAYFTYSEGFKSGLYNMVGLDPVPVDPEEIESYEVGYKMETDRVRFSASAYLYDYQDIQVNAIDNSGTGAGISKVLNAASAEVYGLDMDLAVQLSDGWSVKSGITFTHAEYDDFPDALVYTPNPGNIGNSSGFADVSGNSLERTPDLTAFATINYSTELESGALDLTLNTSYNDGYYWDPANAPRLEQDAFALVNASATWRSPSEKYQVTLFGTNLTDEEYYLFARTSDFGDTASYSKPRSVGIGLDINF